MIFRVIVFAFLAIVGLGFLLLILANLYPAFGTSISCRLYQAITGVVPTPQETRPSLPWYCYPSECKFIRTIVEAANSQELAESVAFQAYRCWRCADYGKGPRDVLCAELYSEHSTDEAGVVSALQAKGHCPDLPDNVIDSTEESTGCGEGNKVFFSSPAITGTIIIKYDSYAHRIVIS
jgi:hypothetical protein